MGEFTKIKQLLENDSISGLEAFKLIDESLEGVDKKLTNKTVNSDIQALREDVEKVKTFLESVQESRNNISRNMIQGDMLMEFFDTNEFNLNKKGLQYLINSIDH